MAQIGRPRKIEVEILKKIPVDVLIQLSNKEISEIFNINASQISLILTEKMNNRMKRKQVIYTNENEIKCDGAWMNSQERLFLKRKLNEVV